MDFVLHCQSRVKLTKSFLKEQRKSGKVPAVCYGKGENLNLLFDFKEFQQVFLQARYHRVMQITVDKMHHHEVLVKAFQMHPVTKEITHIDLLEISQDKPVCAQVPVILSGTPPGVKRGGVLEHKLAKLLLESLPKDIPENIVVQVDALDVGDSIYVRDLSFDTSITVRSKAEQVIVAVASSRVTRMSDEAADAQKDAQK